jgi:hypothetical protein
LVCLIISIDCFGLISLESKKNKIIISKSDKVPQVVKDGNNLMKRPPTVGEEIKYTKKWDIKR